MRANQPCDNKKSAVTNCASKQTKEGIE